MKINNIKPLSVAGIILLLILPYAITSKYTMGIVILTVINIVLVISVNVITGLTGRMSLCQAAFFGIGAYTTAILTTQYDFSFWACLPFAGIIAALIAVLIGWPILKLEGYYLAICTLGLQQLFSLVFLNWVSMTNGPFGIRGIQPPDGIPWLFNLQFGSPKSYYYLYLLFLLVIVLFVRSLLNSRYGRAFLAIREDEISARMFAINTTYHKVLAFALAAFIAAIAGVMYAHYYRYISPGAFNITRSIDVTAMLIIGGSGQIWGCVIGAVLFTFIPELFRGFAEYRTLVIGIAIVVSIIFMPDGIVGQLNKAGTILSKKAKEFKQ